MKTAARLVLLFVPALLLFLEIGSCAHGRGAGAKALEQSGLVDLTTLDPTIMLDIRYATIDNFTHKQIYSIAKCYLVRDIAERLVEIHRELRAEGMGLKVYDCYRPFSAQKKLWAIKPDERFVMKPVEINGKMARGSRHSRGAAVDLTLVDHEGNEIEMPSAFDEFNDKAGRDCLHSGFKVCENMKRLEIAMIKKGFIPLSTEWWHFDGPGWEK